MDAELLRQLINTVARVSETQTELLELIIKIAQQPHDHQHMRTWQETVNLATEIKSQIHVLRTLIKQETLSLTAEKTRENQRGYQREGSDL